MQAIRNGVYTATKSIRYASTRKVVEVTTSTKNSSLDRWLKRQGEVGEKVLEILCLHRAKMQLEETLSNPPIKAIFSSVRAQKSLGMQTDGVEEYESFMSGHKTKINKRDQKELESMEKSISTLCLEGVKSQSPIDILIRGLVATEKENSK